MDEKITMIGDRIAALTLEEAQQLLDYLKEEHGIEPPLTIVPPRFQKQEAPEPEAPTEFAVVLEAYDPSKKISVIKIVRSLIRTGLRETLQLVESAPVTLREGVAKHEAHEMARVIEDAGGEVSLK